MASREIRIATRKSALALWQAAGLAAVKNRRQGPVRQRAGNSLA